MNLSDYFRLFAKNNIIFVPQEPDLFNPERFLEPGAARKILPFQIGKR